MNVGYVESRLDDRVVAVLVNDALRFLFEPVNHLRRPPFLEVARLVILPSCSIIATVSTLSTISRLYWTFSWTVK